MAGGKGETKPRPRTPSGITTRAVRPTNIPVTTSPGTPKTQRDPTDIQRVLDRLDSIEDSLETKIDGVIESHEFTAKQMNEKIDKTVNSGLVQAEQIGALKEESSGHTVQLKVHGLRLSELEEKIERLERERRRNVLVIEGVKEKVGEVTSTIVEKAFEDLQVGFKTEVCTAIFRRGKTPVSDNKEGAEKEPAREREYRGRPIVVILPSTNEKAAIFRNLKNLKDNDNWQGIFFNDDLTEQQSNEQRDLRALAGFAKSKGCRASVKAGVLWLDGRKFRYEDLHRLPDGITLMNAKNLHILEDKGIVFQSPHSPLSNLHPCNVTYRGEAFLSSEAAFQYTKATVCGYHREAQLIKHERNAYKVKNLTKDFKTTREWEETAEQVMREVLLAKFKRNKPCLSFLLATGERSLYEGTGDKYWGCGIPISKAHLISHKNPGKNILGHMLEEVRRALKK